MVYMACEEEEGEGYCLEGEFSPIKKLGNSTGGVLTLKNLFGWEDTRGCSFLIVQRYLLLFVDSFF